MPVYGSYQFVYIGQPSAMLLSQTNPVGLELFSYVNTFFCSNNIACSAAGHLREALYNDVSVILMDNFI